jgi:hypothetical protein
MRTRSLVPLSLAVFLMAQAAPARADGVLPSVATPVQREQAQSRFLRGKDLMTKKKYDEALAEFEASRDIVASPNTRLALARCLLAMGRLVAAYAELGRTAVEAKELTAEDNRYQRAREAALADRAELEPKLGFVALTIENPAEGTRVTVGGEELRRGAWTEPAPVLAGTAQIVVDTPGHAAIQREVTLAVGQKTSMTIDAQSGEAIGGPPPPPEPPPAPAPVRVEGPHLSRAWAYAAGGVGAAGLLTFALFGSMARSTYNDLQTTCNSGPCPPSKTDEIASGKTKQTIANVGLAVGIIGAAAGVTIFVLSAPKGAPAPSAALVISPQWIGVRADL